MTRCQPDRYKIIFLYPKYMGKKVFIVISILAVVGVVCAFMWAKTNSVHRLSMNIRQTLTKDRVDTSIAANEIVITNNALSPTSLTIKIGTILTWRNDDTISHTLTFSNENTNPILIKPHDTYMKTFTNPITITYQCSKISEEGSITVVDTQFTTLKRGG